MVLGSFSYIKNYQSSTIFIFQISKTRNANVSRGIQLESILGKTETVRDESYNYVQSIPFYFELAKRFSEHPEGKEIIPVLFNSKKNILVKLKMMFFETFAYNVSSDSSILLAQSFQKIVSFSKDSDTALIMFVRAGTPELAIRIGDILGKIVRDIILENEYNELSVSDKHIRGQLEASRQRLSEIEKEFLSIKRNESGSSHNSPIWEMEKELRQAKIESQKYQLMVNEIKKEIQANSTFKTNSGDYPFVDNVSIERLSELNQALDVARAKVASVEKSLEKLKMDDAGSIQDEQHYSKLKARFQMEFDINKDLIIKAREFDGLKKLMENSLQIVGNTSLVPAKLKISRPLKFGLGFVLGVTLFLVGLYYYYDFFRVIFDIREIAKKKDKEIISVLPEVHGIRGHVDLWKILPGNHLAIDAFRGILEKVESEKVISVMGTQPKEGMSFIISNLAFNLSRYGKKVLIVDTNWTNPQFSKDLSENIKVLPSGLFKHGKGAIIDQSLLINIIRENWNEFDYILIDTCPSSHNNDFLVVGTLANVNIVLCSFLETYETKFMALINKLESSGIENYCFIMNKVDLGHDLLAMKSNHIIYSASDLLKFQLKKTKP